jgi:hypothetical protein
MTKAMGDLSSKLSSWLYIKLRYTTTKEVKRSPVGRFDKDIKPYRGMTHSEQ